MDSLPHLPEPEFRDTIHKALSEMTSLIPIPIPYASEIIGTLVKPTYEKRMREYQNAIRNGLIELQNTYEQFKFESLQGNDKFATAVLETMQIAMRNYDEVKHEYLINSVLNTALTNSPDQIKQKIFLVWLNEFTSWHIKILRLFDSGLMPEINLDKSDWASYTLSLGKMCDQIENSYPEMSGETALEIKIVRDLHDKNLIANRVPSPGLTNRVNRSPIVTPLGREFLDFLKSPLKD